jgi:hypothetical protein
VHSANGRPTDLALESTLLFNTFANLSICNGDGDTGAVRHVGIDMRPNPLFPTEMDVYSTRIGDAPERIVVTRIVLRKSVVCPYLRPSEWAATQAVEVLRPGTSYEGADEPKVPSEKGDGPPYRVNQLRDPSPFYDVATGHHYLAYAIGGEFGVSLARIVD